MANPCNSAPHSLESYTNLGVQSVQDELVSRDVSPPFCVSFRSCAFSTVVGTISLVVSSKTNHAACDEFVV